MRQKRKILMTFAVLIFCIGGLGSNADAALITIAISGQVTGVSDQYNHFGGQIQSGDIITGTYAYESTTLDSNPSPNLGDYVWETLSAGIWLSIGGFDFWTNPSQVSFHIGVYKDSLEDQLVIASSQNLPLSNGTLVQYILWQLSDSTSTALLSDALPLTAPDLTKWSSNVLRISTDRDFTINAVVTSATLVPEPATLLLLACGLWFTRRLSK